MIWPGSGQKNVKNFDYLAVFFSFRNWFVGLLQNKQSISYQQKEIAGVNVIL
jgi:hypothetical protein